MLLDDSLLFGFEFDCHNLPSFSTVSSASLRAFRLMRKCAAQSSHRCPKNVMADLAEGTGRTFFRNNNDLAAGFTRVPPAPEFSYLLGFSPPQLNTHVIF